MNGLEIERKFLIQYPDLTLLNKMSNCIKVHITQTYLPKEEDCIRRVRREIFTDGRVRYTKNTKKRISKITRIENESEITEDEYESLRSERDMSLSVLEKDRYRIYLDDLCYEIDVYPFWSDRAVMEVELKNEKQRFEIPDFIRVIDDVTNDKKYSNYGIAKRGKMV